MNPLRRLSPLVLVYLGSCTSVQNHPGSDGGHDAGADASHDAATDDDAGHDAGHDAGDDGATDAETPTDPWRDCFEALEDAPTGAPCDFDLSCFAAPASPGSPERRGMCIGAVFERNLITWHCPTEPGGTPPFTDCSSEALARPGDACEGQFWCGGLDDEGCASITNCQGGLIFRQQFCAVGEALPRPDAESWSECPPDELPAPLDLRPRPGDLCETPFTCVVRGSSVRYGSEDTPVILFCVDGILHFGPQPIPGFDPSSVVCA